MGYVLPSEKDLPDPTLKEFSENPVPYWKKLREYEAVPNWCHHFGLTDIYRFVVNKLRGGKNND